MDRVGFPPPVTNGGLKAYVEFGGKPPRLKTTLLLNPGGAGTVAGEAVLVPATADCESGVAEMVNHAAFVALKCTKTGCASVWLPPENFANVPVPSNFTL